MIIDNTLSSYVAIWQQLEATHQRFAQQCRRFCLRSLIREWVSDGTLVIATAHNTDGHPPDPNTIDDFIWRICRLASRGDLEVLGRNELPQPALSPRLYREIIIALVRVSLGIGKHGVNIEAVEEGWRLSGLPQTYEAKDNL